MVVDWFCKVAGNELGPLSSQQLKAMAIKGELGPDDLVRQGSNGPWVAANQVRGLFSAAPSPAGRPGTPSMPVAKPLEPAPAKPAAKRKLKVAKAVEPPAAKGPAEPASRPPTETPISALPVGTLLPASDSPGPIPPPLPSPAANAADTLDVFPVPDPLVARAAQRNSAAVQALRRKQGRNVPVAVFVTLLVTAAVLAAIAVAIWLKGSGSVPNQAAKTPQTPSQVVDLKDLDLDRPQAPALGTATAAGAVSEKAAGKPAGKPAGDKSYDASKEAGPNAASGASQAAGTGGQPAASQPKANQPDDEYSHPPPIDLESSLKELGGEGVRRESEFPGNQLPPAGQTGAEPSAAPAGPPAAPAGPPAPPAEK